MKGVYDFQYAHAPNHLNIPWYRMICDMAMLERFSCWLELHVNLQFRFLWKNCRNWPEKQSEKIFIIFANDLVWSMFLVFFCFLLHILPFFWQKKNRLTKETKRLYRFLLVHFESLWLSTQLLYLISRLK